jgi:hypothetical protein
MATTPKIGANRLNMDDPLLAPLSFGLELGIFKLRGARPGAALAVSPCRERHRQQAGGAGQQRLCDAVSAWRLRNQYPPLDRP